MKAVRYRNASGEFRIGRLEDESIVDAGPAGEQGFVPTRGPGRRSRRPTGERTPSARSRSRTGRAAKLICIGLNYRDHAEESQLDMPEVPVIFAKWTTSLIGHGETIVIPREETRPDYEGELAVVIGEPVYRATGAAARAAVGAYTCFHDVSGRRAQLETPLRQFTYGKSFDTFGPLGPCLVDADGRRSRRARGHDRRVRRDDAGLEHQQPDLRRRGARRVRLARRPRSSPAT